MKFYSRVTDTNGVNHSWVFDAELVLVNQENLLLLEKYMDDWWWVSIIYALLYIVAVFVGKQWMINRQKYELRTSLILWNIGLSVFSFIGLCRCLPEFIHSLTNNGYFYSLCDTSFKKDVTGFWYFLFMISKVPETIDTLFIVLRKQNLIFLHWYHHASVLVYCFYSYTYFVSTGRWFVLMNYFVHTIMYGYYALRAARFRLPRSLQQVITILQIIQMIVGCFVNISAFNYKKQGLLCATSFINIQISLAMYASYFILFANFFYTAYIKKGSRSKSD